ncbi:uncharacterized protein LOC101454562 [Ceratitis capitata]|uniref:(Mediterranean fruit fly) hypothetical protein n=1 Tax=Ceratitis capitata TaxID=7213 RepID=W8C746_CERCA|nr:uncharacterized protein LOC101454562 [Ceratitis capitata]CAD7005564.1 unnamed protein product [Ceratitis capitata]
MEVTRLSEKRRRQQLDEYKKMILDVKPRVDDVPPKLNVRDMLRASKLRDDCNAFERIRRMNNELLRNVNIISRIGGQLDTFRERKMNSARSRIPLILLQNRYIERDNIKFGQFLKTVGTTLDTHVAPHLLRHVRKDSVEFVLPAQILAKYHQIKMPPYSQLRRLLRPVIYFDFYVKGLRPAGRITIQLYTEACPQVVLAFVRACRNGDKNKIFVNRLFPGLWLDCCLLLPQEQKIKPKHIEYDMRALDHNRSGTLAFTLDQQDALHKDALKFTLSVKPLQVLNGKRVAFGVASSGTKVLDSMQVFGMKKSGKLTKSIIISDMGLLV